MILLVYNFPLLLIAAQVSCCGAAKGETVMKAFDSREFEKHKAEAKEKWGSTDAYKEHAKKQRITPSRSGMTLPRE